MTLEEAKKLSCDDCEFFIDKGEDESYCRLAHYREFTRSRKQRKPRFCPIERRAKIEAGVVHVADSSDGR